MSVRRRTCPPPPPPPSTIIFFLLFLCCSVSADDQLQDAQLQSLLKFKSAFDNSNVDVFGSWGIKDNPVCSFTGIKCDPGELVSKIDLSGRQLAGTDVPFEAICSLPSLQTVALGGNSLRGVVAENSLKNCTRLQHLDLGQNSFAGEVPDLSSLRELSYLNLNGSGFSGKFPWKSLENLTHLAFLSLGDNPFDPSPFPTEILKLDKLYWLYLTNSSITGELPADIGNLSLLQNLELSYNNLTGAIPPSIGKLRNLWQLEIYNNNLTGTLPNGFGNLANLKKFDASHNQLEGDLSELRFLTKLVSLQLFENRFVGEVPKELGEFKDLANLSLYTNNLTGELPQKLGSWSGMEFIDVSENSLTGPIPPGMCANNKMTKLLILQNNFSGEIPASYANCESLNRLRVSQNSLSGIVPAGIWGLPNIEHIDLSSNRFEGPVTTDIGKAKSLAQLFLGGNRFSGELPDEISEASPLDSIQLDSNQFSGKIPESIGKLKKLGTLSLEGNQFSGSIPDSLGSCASISQINLARNSLSGKIPASLGSLPNLNSLNLSGNKLSGEIPASLSSLRLSLLDLSNNRLAGRIPDSLSIAAFKTSFAGNPGLCGRHVEDIRPCSSSLSSNSGKSGSLRAVIACLIAGTLVLLVSLAWFLYLKIRKTEEQKHPLKRSSWKMKLYHVLSFTEEDIIDAIKSENLIGKGGSGNVYKVVLSDGQELAVKHIWTTTPDSGDRKSCRSSAAMLRRGKSRSPDFDAEVATLSSVRHVNVVKLYCSISSEDSNLLVYEYMPNGSLWDRLHTSNKIAMGWGLRYDIALGAAKGLEYLHHGCSRPVTHRDVKSSNILLDENWKPRIADFGLAKMAQAGGDWTHVIAGTLGYIAPGQFLLLI